MIANTVIGKGFTGALNYVINKKDAQILGSNCLSDSSNVNVLANEFRNNVFHWAKNYQKNFKRVVDHTSLSFAKGEHLSDDKMEEVARDYMEMKGYADCQYIIVRHNDTEHEHLHVVASRVSLIGEKISDSNNYMDNVTITNNLEHKYNLVRSDDHKREQGRNFEIKEKKTKEKELKEKIRVAIKKAIDDSSVKSIDDFKKSLLADGIEVKLLKNSNGYYGCSFKVGDYTVSGSKVGYKYSALRDEFRAKNQTETQTPKEILTATIDAICVKSNDFEEFQKNLKDEKILATYRFNKTGMYGVNFFYKGVKYKGSEVDSDANKLKERIAFPTKKEYYESVQREDIYRNSYDRVSKSIQNGTKVVLSKEQQANVSHKMANHLLNELIKKDSISDNKILAMTSLLLQGYQFKNDVISHPELFPHLERKKEGMSSYASSVNQNSYSDKEKRLILNVIKLDSSKDDTERYGLKKDISQALKEGVILKVGQLFMDSLTAETKVTLSDLASYKEIYNTRNSTTSSQLPLSEEGGQNQSVGGGSSPVLTSATNNMGRKEDEEEEKIKRKKKGMSM